jgi:hypothetical protein
MRLYRSISRWDSEVEALHTWTAHVVDQAFEAKDHTIGVHRFSQR